LNRFLAAFFFNSTAAATVEAKAQHDLQKKSAAAAAKKTAATDATATTTIASTTQQKRINTPPLSRMMQHTHTVFEKWPLLQLHFFVLPDQDERRPTLANRPCYKAYRSYHAVVS
jgi:hypothetical protein